MAKRKKNKLSDNTKAWIAIIGTTLVIVLLVILCQREPRPSLEDLGFKKEDYYYYKDDITAYRHESTGNVSFEQEITPNYKSHNIIEILNKFSKCDLSYMEEIIDNIISSQAYLELDYLSFDTCDISYDLRISKSYDNTDKYIIEQYIDIDRISKDKGLKIDNFHVTLKDNYETIPKYLIDLYKLNFKEEDEKVKYGFYKLLSNYSDVNNIHLSLVIDNKSYNFSSFNKGTISVYDYDYVSTYENHDIYVEYDIEYFESYYEKIIDEDLELLNIKTNRTLILNEVKEYLKLFESSQYRDGMEIKLDRFNMGLKIGYNKYNLWYDYK